MRPNPAGIRRDTWRAAPFRAPPAMKRARYVVGPPPDPAVRRAEQIEAALGHDDLTRRAEGKRG